MKIELIAFYADADAGDGMKIRWSDKDYGYGEIDFFLRDGKIEIDSEFMGKDFVKRLLDKLVEDAIIVE